MANNKRSAVESQGGKEYKVCSYGLTSESLGGIKRSRSAIRDNQGKFVSNEWRKSGMSDDEVALRFFLYCAWI